MGMDISIVVEMPMLNGDWIDMKHLRDFYNWRSYYLFSLLSDQARGENEAFKEACGFPEDSPWYDWYKGQTWEDATCGFTWYYVDELRGYLQDHADERVAGFLEMIAGWPANWRILFSFDY